MNLFESFLDYWQWSSLVEICIGMEQVESLIVQVDFYMEVLGCASAIILTVFVFKVNIFLLLEELPQKIIPYFIVEWKSAL
jgi:hypothetical protein